MSYQCKWCRNPATDFHDCFEKRNGIVIPIDMHGNSRLSHAEWMQSENSKKAWAILKPMDLARFM